MSKKLLNNKKEAIITYASDFDGQLNEELIKQHLLSWFFNKNYEYEIIIAKEEPHEERRDDKGKLIEKGVTRKHFHIWVKTDSPMNVSVKAWDIELLNPVWVEGDFDEENPHSGYFNSKEEIIEKFGDEKGYKKISKAHPNIKGKKYGHTIYMIDYVTKQYSSVWSNVDLETLKEKYRNDFKNNYNENGKKKSPEDIINFPALKKKGMTAQEALVFIQENHSSLFFRYWHKWETPFYKYFSENKDEDIINLDAEYWVPKEVIQYWNETYKPYYENRKNRDWLRKHRMDRPGTLLWIGKSQCGKSSVCKSIFMGNYYHTLIDGMVDFDENAPCVILDDFHPEVKKYLPSWKCWLGCQTKFTVNPKFGKRRKINWGHPCIWLNNYDIYEYNKDDEIVKRNKFVQEDLDYLYTNCLYVDTKDHKLWEEPRNPENWVKIKVRDYRPDLVEEENEKLSKEVEPPSERECDTNQENEPVLIPQVDGDWDIEEEYPVWDQENDPEGIKFKKEMAKFESDDNPLPRLGKRGIDWEYAELLPGHEGKLFKTPKKSWKRREFIKNTKGIDSINSYKSCS